MTASAKSILLTGASGNLGRILAHSLAAQGMRLRLTDIAPFPDALPPGASFTRVDLGNGPALLRLAERAAARSCISAASPWSSRSKR